MKKIKFLSLIAIASLTVTGCFNFSDFKVPNSVAVKTTAAEYNFTVVDLQDSDLLAKNFNIAEMLNNQMGSGEESGEQNSENNSPKMDMYIYNPNNAADRLQMAMRMSLQEINLDFSQYFQNADLTSGLEGMDIPSKTIEIPEIKKSGEETLQIADMNDRVNSLLKFAGKVSKQEQDISIDFDEDYGFDLLKYKTGAIVFRKLTVQEIKTGFPALYDSLDPNLKQTIEVFADSFETASIPDGTKVIVKYTDSNGNEIQREAVFANGEAELSLDNFEFHSTGTSIQFDDFEDTPEDLYSSKFFFAEVKSGSKLELAQGVSYKEPISLDIQDQVIEIPATDIKSCIIDQGLIKVGIEQPEGWSLGLNYNIALSQKDDFDEDVELITLTQDDEENGKELEDLALRFDNIAVSGSASIVLDNSSIAFDNLPKFTYDLEIKKIKEAVVVMSDSFKLDPVSMTQELPSEVLQYIKSIKWDPSGIAIKYTNTLPAGNDIKLIVSSNFLGLERKTYRVETGVSDERTIKILCGENWLTPLGTGTGEFNSIDFNAEIDLENFDKDDNTLTIYDVEAGANYEISMKIEPIFNWNTVSINASVANKGDTVNTGVNLGSMLGDNEIFKMFSDKIELSKVPLYLYCDLPELLSGDLSFNGTIKAYLADKDNEEIILDDTEVYFLAKQETDGSYSPDTLVPCQEPEIVTNDAGELTTEFTTSSVNIPEDAMAKIVNKSLKNSNGVLCMDYNLGVSSKNNASVIEITSAQFDELKNNSEPTAIKISAVVVVPFEFNVTADEGIDIDFASLMNMGKDSENSDDANGNSESGENNNNDSSEKDLLGRSGEDSTLDSISQYLEAIDTIGVTLDITKIPLKADGIQFVIDLDGKERTVDGTTRGTKFRETTFTLPKDDFEVSVKDILETNPLVPTYGLKIPKGNFYFLRDMNISLNAKLKIKTKDDCLIPIPFGGKDSDSQSEEN